MISNDLGIAISDAAKTLYHRGYKINTGSWHSQKVDDSHEFTEVLNHVLSAPMILDSGVQLAKLVRPNLPWANIHFAERVGMIPLNPPPSHTSWPFAQKNNEVHTDNFIFSHSYPERIWPKHANKYGMLSHMLYTQRNYGIRYNLGDLNDLVKLLVREPLTRQAYLPIWFPEDTGATENQRVPCTLGYHFIVRNDRIFCNYYIRSCDMVRHLRDDVYMAVRLTAWILEQLKIDQANKGEGFDWAKIQPGLLTMNITSLHCFANEKEMLKKHF